MTRLCPGEHLTTSLNYFNSRYTAILSNQQPRHLEENHSGNPTQAPPHRTGFLITDQSDRSQCPSATSTGVIRSINLHLQLTLHFSPLLK